jgi:cbb3-type cytochrome oxidase maturation protein
MESLWILIPMSVLIALAIGAVFWWAAGSGQFDDLDGPGQRILIDDDSPPMAEQPSALPVVPTMPPTPPSKI